jgi:lysophospholipase L1-like esterase
VNGVALDLGPIEAPVPWNSLEDPVAGRLANLLDFAGQPTAIEVEVVDAFADVNAFGWDALDPALGIPTAAGRDGFWGNAKPYRGRVEQRGALQWRGLDPQMMYGLQVFASRKAADQRSGAYLLTGSTTSGGLLNASDNVSQSLHLQAQPDSAGTLTLAVMAADSLNDSEQGAFYLGAVVLTWPGSPGPGGSIAWDWPRGGERWQAGAEVELRWTSTTGQPLVLSAEVDGAALEIATLPPTATDYRWRVPAADSIRLFLRAGEAAAATGWIAGESSNAVLPIVVLGSSTAAGAGASIPDSAWVNRFRDALGRQKTQFSVVNLARGGYSTCHLLPDGADVSGCSAEVDTLRNITRALGLNPAAIVVNLPSNDAAGGMSLDLSLRNFEAILEEARDVPIFVATPQPRNGLRADRMEVQLKTLEVMREWEGTVDFWTGIAEPDGTVSPRWDSGDGVHLNDAGHRLLAERVAAVDIPGAARAWPVGNWEVAIEDTVLTISGAVGEVLDWHWVERTGELTAHGRVALGEFGLAEVVVPPTVAAGVRFLHLQNREATDRRGQVVRVFQEPSAD